MKRSCYAMLVVLMLLTQACASATPATQVTSIDPLVGKWTGTVKIGPRIDFIHLTIYPDRTLIAIWADITARGTVTVSSGQASYQMSPPPQEGSILLYTGKGKPQLYLENFMGSFAATVEPQE